MMNHDHPANIAGTPGTINTTTPGGWNAERFDDLNTTHRCGHSTYGGEA